MRKEIEKNKGFIQVILLIITQFIIVCIILAAIVAATKAYREGGLSSITAAVLEAFRR